MTNTNMEIFKNEEFGSVRIIEEDGKYLFCAQMLQKRLVTAMFTPLYSVIATVS